MFRVHNDIASALDNSHSVVLVMLDLSAAFDVIDHAILFNLLQHSFGIDGDALLWIKSYVHGRSQRIAIGPVKSNSMQLKYGDRSSITRTTEWLLSSADAISLWTRNIMISCYARNFWRKSWDPIIHCGGVLVSNKHVYPVPFLYLYFTSRSLFYVLRLAVWMFCFVDIDGIVEHLKLNSLFKTILAIDQYNP
jgi:hypothetical protein